VPAAKIASSPWSRRSRQPAAQPGLASWTFASWIGDPGDVRGFVGFATSEFGRIDVITTTVSCHPHRSAAGRSRRVRSRRRSAGDQPARSLGGGVTGSTRRESGRDTQAIKSKARIIRFTRPGRQSSATYRIDSESATRARDEPRARGSSRRAAAAVWHRPSDRRDPGSDRERRATGRRVRPHPA